MSTKQTILNALYKFVSQRPGLEFGNYGNLSAYRSEMRSITRDLQHARTLIRAVELRESITAEDLVKAAEGAFSGRLSINVRKVHSKAQQVAYEGAKANGGIAEMPPPDSERVEIDYCTGQYWPTEYRRAVCAVLASALWSYWRDGCMPEPTGYVVRCYDDNGKRELATRRVFEKREEADKYASTVAQSRCPTVWERYKLPGGKGQGTAGDYLRTNAAREFGRGIAQRWFN